MGYNKKKNPKKCATFVEFAVSGDLQSFLLSAQALYTAKTPFSLFLSVSPFLPSLFLSSSSSFLPFQREREKGGTHCPVLSFPSDSGGPQRDHSFMLLGFFLMFLVGVKESLVGQEKSFWFSFAKTYFFLS